MARQEATIPTTCDWCGQHFTTSRQHPRHYCSIACEEGRGPVAMSNPASPDYHLYLKGEPEALVGKTVVAKGLSYSDYSPDWHRTPDDYTNRELVSVDEDEQTLVRKTDVVIGQVTDYDADGYTLVHENVETGEISERTVHDFLMVEQIREGRWWVDG